MANREEKETNDEEVQILDEEEEEASDTLLETLSKATAEAKESKDKIKKFYKIVRELCEENVKLEERAKKAEEEAERQTLRADKLEKEMSLLKSGGQERAEARSTGSPPAQRFRAILDNYGLARTANPSSNAGASKSLLRK